MPPKPLQNIRHVIALTCCLGISDLLLSWPGTIWAEITTRELCGTPDSETRVSTTQHELRLRANIRFWSNFMNRKKRQKHLHIRMDIPTSQHHKVMHLVKTSLVLARRRNIDAQVKSRNHSTHLQIPMDISTRPTFTNPTFRKDSADFWLILQSR
jgi:hypothetical protein